MAHDTRGRALRWGWRCAPGAGALAELQRMAALQAPASAASTLTLPGWERLIPQLVAALGHPAPRVQEALKSILMSLSDAHPSELALAYLAGSLERASSCADDEPDKGEDGRSHMAVRTSIDLPAGRDAWAWPRGHASHPPAAVALWLHRLTHSLEQKEPRVVAEVGFGAVRS